MGWSFRKSIKVLPGIKINLSNNGVSTSIGARGATVNLKPGRKAKLTVGIPGTGISYSTSMGQNRQGNTSSGFSLLKILAVVGIVFTIIFIIL